ncbi:MAG: hypothetical protein LBP59_08900, partial [Planctomycetaceae bacterium]|nr:hypothetical protein [Planctomycetaceae bacterium]
VLKKFDQQITWIRRIILGTSGTMLLNFDFMIIVILYKSHNINHSSDNLQANGCDPSDDFLLQKTVL